MKEQTTPAMAPMRSADMGWTKPEAWVMVARPATAPEIAPKAVGLPLLSHSATTQPMAPAAAANWVLIKALVASGPALSALPALKPNQPTHSIAAPMKLSTIAWGGISCCG